MKNTKREGFEMRRKTFENHKKTTSKIYNKKNQTKKKRKKFFKIQKVIQTHHTAKPSTLRDKPEHQSHHHHC